MAARLKDDGRQPTVQLVRQKDFARIVKDCKNPPKPSDALIEMFARGRQRSDA